MSAFLSLTIIQTKYLGMDFSTYRILENSHSEKGIWAIVSSERLDLLISF
jgi:hypothetical protein